MHESIPSQDAPKKEEKKEDAQRIAEEIRRYIASHDVTLRDLRDVYAFFAEADVRAVDGEFASALSPAARDLIMLLARSDDWRVSYGPLMTHSVQRHAEESRARELLNAEERHIGSIMENIVRIFGERAQTYKEEVADIIHSRSDVAILATCGEEIIGEAKVGDFDVLRRAEILDDFFFDVAEWHERHPERAVTLRFMSMRYART